MSDRAANTITELLSPYVAWDLDDVAKTQATRILAALKTDHIAVVDLPEQYIGYQAEGTITEFRFGEDCAGVTVSRDDAGQIRIYVIGAEEEMTLSQAREFFVAGLAAVIAAEEVANV